MTNGMRLPLVGLDVRDELTAEVFGEIRSVRGEVTNLFRVVANEPTLLPAFFGLSRRVRDESTLPARLSQLAILATAFTIGSEYETAHHLLDAERAGVTREEIARLSTWDLGGFAAPERYVISYAHQVTSTRSVDDAIFNGVLEALGPAGAIELGVLVGWYHLVAAIVEPLHVVVEPDRHRAEGRTNVTGGKARSISPRDVGDE